MVLIISSYLIIQGGYTKPMQLSPALSEFMGTDIMPRTEVVKQLWAYFRENNLQNPNDRREILLDKKLQKVFKRKSVTMFSMNKFLSPVCWNNNTMYFYVCLPKFVFCR